MNERLSATEYAMIDVLRARGFAVVVFKPNDIPEYIFPSSLEYFLFEEGFAWIKDRT